MMILQRWSSKIVLKKHQLISQVKENVDINSINKTINSMSVLLNNMILDKKTVKCLGANLDIKLKWWEHVKNEEISISSLKILGSTTNEYTYINTPWPRTSDEGNHRRNQENWQELRQGKMKGLGVYAHENQNFWICLFGQIYLCRRDWIEPIEKYSSINYLFELLFIILTYRKTALNWLWG